MILLKNTDTQCPTNSTDCRQVCNCIDWCEYTDIQFSDQHKVRTVCLHAEYVFTKSGLAHWTRHLKGLEK